MAINRSNIAKELLPGLNAVFGVEYGDVNDEHVPLFDVENSDRSFEEEVLFTGFGSAPTKTEGSAVQFDTAQESEGSCPWSGPCDGEHQAGESCRHLQQRLRGW
jgi:hypothetical protein